ncbi:plasmid pRiA4b ORF-3 family protein [Rhizobium sp. 1AS11]|uniref:plasmid pRiA4b ORF-3 family protein n=1 Tax=Rhizobium acaciae TaxID=2989736 RepID=UPI002221B4D3|nr:plasmid pRiA4b ORF-3 family protein [Rhizobium acaciae]MCW1413036.1 plasmid pRiA4b ORF-3 family protein [Rhizobium acaciae]MCW1745188.1 plasmid pRiA4b ORF-3 family protein [Rhizobium acaciae]
MRDLIVFLLSNSTSTPKSRPRHLRAPKPSDTDQSLVLRRREWKPSGPNTDAIDNEPRLHCPPEDIGGPWGYREFIEALADPDHERHEELIEGWGGNQFDTDVIDKPAIELALLALAKKWTRKLRSKT